VVKEKERMDEEDENVDGRAWRKECCRALRRAAGRDAMIVCDGAVN